MEIKYAGIKKVNSRYIITTKKTVFQVFMKWKFRLSILHVFDLIVNSFFVSDLVILYQF